MLMVANEFLDALPIRQFVRGHRDWSERMVALDREDRLVFADGPESPALSLLVPDDVRNAARPAPSSSLPGQALALSAVLGSRLEHDPGAALFIDYGYFPSRAGTTLRASPTMGRLTRWHPPGVPI